MSKVIRRLKWSPELNVNEFAFNTPLLIGDFESNGGGFVSIILYESIFSNEDKTRTRIYQLVYFLREKGDNSIHVPTELLRTSDTGIANKAFYYLVMSYVYSEDDDIIRIFNKFKEIKDDELDFVISLF